MIAGLSGAGARQYIRKSKEKTFFEKKERAHQEIKKYFEKNDCKLQIARPSGHRGQQG